MKLQCFQPKAIQVVAAMALSICGLNGAIIYDSGTQYVSDTDPTQYGRIIRARPPSDWSQPNPFPGTFQTDTQFNYRVFSIPVVSYPYAQIDFDSVGLGVFAAAYSGSYDPTDLSKDYLGDEGSSGEYFPGDPTAFQIGVPVPGNLLIVVSTASADGFTTPFSFLVEGFTNTQFDDTVPEPSTVALSVCGLIYTGLIFIRKSKIRTLGQN